MRYGRTTAGCIRCRQTWVLDKMGWRPTRMPFRDGLENRDLG